MKSSLDIWSVFLQDGVTLFRSDSNVLISSEGITTVGVLGAFFRPVLVVGFCHPLVGRSALKREGSAFSCLCFWRGLCGYPSSQRGSGSWPFFFFWPCYLLPSHGGLVCFVGLFYTWCLSGDSPVLLGSPCRLPPRLVSLGGPLLGPPAVSSWLHGVGVVRRAIQSPGPL